MRRKSLVECYEERIQTLLNLKEANYRAYEELDKKAHDFSEWLEVRLREHEIQHHFAVSECYAIQQKFDEVFFAVKASSDKTAREGVTKMSETKTKNRKRYFCTKNETYCSIKNCHYKFITQYAFNSYKKYCLWREKLDFNL